METNLQQKADCLVQGDQLNPLFNDAVFSPQMLIDEAKSLATREPMTSRDILRKLLDQIEPVDFLTLADVDDKSKLTNAHYRIIVIEQILKIAIENSWDLCRNQEFIYAFNGCFWSLLDEGELKSFLGKAAEKLGVHWEKSRDYNFRNGIFEQFLESANFVAPERTDSVLIPLLNGTFEIKNRKGSLRGFDKRDFLTYQLPFNFDPDAAAPMFLQYLSEVLPGDERQQVLAEYVGYLFTNLKLEKALVLYGTGANGKSVFFEIVNSLLGASNTSHYSLSSLTDRNGYHRAMLVNRLVNYSSEISGNLEASVFKQLVSGEPVEARLPYGRPMVIRHYAKLIFNANTLPHDIEHTNAFFRRFLIVPFDVTIDTKNQDAELAHRITQCELPGIFNWALSGLERLSKNKAFTDCQAIRAQLDDYKKQSDSVAVFVEDSCYEKSTNGNTSHLKDLYREYKAYCLDNGYRPGSIKTLAERLRNLGYKTEKKRTGVVVEIQKQIAL